MANLKVSDMTAILAGAIDAANDVVHLVDVSAGTAGDRKATVAALVQSAVGANYTRTVNVNAALSTTPQSVKVNGTDAALKVGTTGIESTGTLTVAGVLAVGSLVGANGVDLRIAPSPDRVLYLGDASDGQSLVLDGAGIGFYGHAAVPKPAVPASPTAAQIAAALASLGLIQVG